MSLYVVIFTYMYSMCMFTCMCMGGGAGLSYCIRYALGDLASMLNYSSNYSTLIFVLLIPKNRNL